MIEVQIDDSAWRQPGPRLTEQVRRAARIALARADSGKKRNGGLTVLLTGDDRLQMLSRDYRGKDKPTNVLSFPGTTSDYLGDIAIAFGTTAAEAQGAGVPLVNHLLHLTVHGVLHLLGYDHERSEDAEIMEALETTILADMDIANPHPQRGRAA